MKSANDYSIKGKIYSEHGLQGTGYLAFKEIPALLTKYYSGGRVLDFGCGSGRATRLIKALGYECDGVDISDDMLKEAKSKDTSGHYLKIINGNIPFPDESFSMVLSSLVLFEIPTLEEIVFTLKEIKRVMQPEGICIIVTGSEEMYRRNWLTLKNTFPENKNLKSGDLAKVLLSDIHLELYDYFWTKADYEACIAEAGLSLIESRFPLGSPDDGCEWKDESLFSPYLILVLKKSLNEV